MLTTDVPTTFDWPKSPYKGLSYYGPSDVPLFAGRERAVRRCAEQLTNRNTRLLILHGPTGCGKSSFLRAGLIPFLEGQNGRYQFARQLDGASPEALFVRSTDAPLKALAAELYKFVTSAVFETEDGPEKLDSNAVLLGCESAAEFVEKAGNSADQLIASLAGVATEWPRSLALVVDQGEEVLTLKSERDADAEKARNQFFDFVFKFNKTDFDLKLIIALRTEYFGKFTARMGRSLRDLNRVEIFYLDVLTEPEIAEAIERPTSKKDLHGRPYDHYQFEFADTLPGQIAGDVLNNKNIKGGVLPVVQIICENLYWAGKTLHPKEPFTITVADYQALPPVEAQLEGYLKQKLEAFGESKRIIVSEFEVDRWKDVLSGLSTKQIDGTVVTQLADIDHLRKLARKAGCRLPFADTMRYLADPEVRVLRGEEIVDSRTNIPVMAYSLGHDAIGLVMEDWKSVKEATARSVRTMRLAYRVAGCGMLTLAAALVFFRGYGFTSLAFLGLVLYGGATLVMGFIPSDYFRRLFAPLVLRSQRHFRMQAGRRAQSRP